MVGTNAVEVERELIDGSLACPGCGAELRPWSSARWRVIRERDRERRLRPRRARCRGCRATHVLLPVTYLSRRRDAVEVIGAALLAKEAGDGHRVIAAGLGLPATTVRGWLRRFAARSGEIRAYFVALAHRIDASLRAVEPRGSPSADALEAIGVAADAAARRFGPTPVWWFVSGATGGALIANTSSPFRSFR